MLILIGTGINFDLTLGGMEALEDSNEIYIETYTNLIENEKIEKLESKIGKKIKKLDRKDVESNFLIKRASEKKVALLVSGDPLTATTHVSLLLDAKKAKIAVKVLHNSSIYTSAAGVTGLQIYRFGKTASLVNPRENYAPKSSLEVIRKNLENNMHSLVLLDTEPKPMEAVKALEMLKEFDYAIVLSRVGEENEKIIYGKISDIIRKNLGSPPFTIIIPAKLHIVEEEYLDNFKV